MKTNCKNNFLAFSSLAKWLQWHFRKQNLRLWEKIVSLTMRKVTFFIWKIKCQMGYSMFFVIRFRKCIQNMSSWKNQSRYTHLSIINIYTYSWNLQYANNPKTRIHETCNMQIIHKHNKDTSNFLIPLLELVCYYVQYNYNEQLDFCLISKNTK